ncbi:MAG: hypothetical protein M1837_004506 [Sclerophora amabilis]|nr:MAG: hypothetical protein M1837_004506 [Sclerophora amabilis]
MTENKHEDDTRIEHVGSPTSGPNPTFGAKLKAHLKRWWVYVAFPKIAQDGVDGSVVDIESMILSEPTPTSFHLKQEQFIRSNNTYHPRLDSFNASLFLEDTLPDIKPFAYIQLPPIQSGDRVPMSLDQTVQIADLEQFTKYSTLVMNSEEYRLGIRGRVGLHEMAFPVTTVDYNEVVTLKGLNGLQGFDVVSYKILGKAEPDGANMIGKVYIPNPSVMTIAMVTFPLHSWCQCKSQKKTYNVHQGNVTMNLYVQGDFIGTSLLPDLVLRPGNNTVDMRSTTDQEVIFGKLSEFEDGLIPIDIVGNSSVYHGQHLTYYEAALKSNTQHIKLDLASAGTGV